MMMMLVNWLFACPPDVRRDRGLFGYMMILMNLDYDSHFDIRFLVTLPTKVRTLSRMTTSVISNAVRNLIFNYKNNYKLFI